MTLRILSTVITLLATGCAAQGQPAPAAPAAKPAAPAAKPAAPTAAETKQAMIMKILKDLEVAGAKHPAIQADVDYRIDRMLTGETEQRTGYVKFQKRTAKTPDKFRMHFDTLSMDGGRKLKSVVDYAFDGMWLSIAKDRIKQLTKYQVAAPGQRVEPLRLGKGPFPMPFGQSVEDIVKFFIVTQPARKARKSDPPNADYVVFTTRKERKKDLNVTKIEQWIDKTTHLPIMISAYDKSKNKTTVIFTKVKTDVTFETSIFALAQKRGWKPIVIQPLKKMGNPAPKP